jgi:hypothetical protein
MANWLIAATAIGECDHISIHDYRFNDYQFFAGIVCWNRLLK